MNEDGTRDLEWWRILAWKPRAPRALGACLAFAIVPGIVLVLLLGPPGALGFLFGGVGLVTVLAGGKGDRQPPRLGRPRPRKMLKSGAFLGSLGYVLAFALGSFLSGGGIGAAVTGDGAGLGATFAGDIRGVLADDQHGTSSRTPVASWRDALKYGIVVGLVVAVGVGLADWPGQGKIAPFSGLGYGIGLTLSVCLVWPVFVTEIQMAMTWRTPVRLIRFLEDARSRNVLRTAGPVYQFRHALLQDRLAGTKPAPRPAPALSRDAEPVSSLEATWTARDNLAAAHQAAGRHADAIALYEQTAADRERTHGAAFPGTLLALCRLGLAYLSAGRLDHAIDVLERAAARGQNAHGTDDPVTLHSGSCLATAYMLAGRHAHAITLLEQVAADQERRHGTGHSDALDARTELGLAYALEGRLDDAIDILNHVVAESQPAHDTTFLEAVAYRGEIYRLACRNEEALADFNRAIEIDPSHGLAIGRRGQTYERLGRHEEALADLDRAIELEPQDALAIGYRGKIYRLTGRYKEALADLNHAIELDPDNDRWHYQCSLACQRCGLAANAAERLEAAIRLVRASIRSSASPSTDLYNLAIYLAAQGEYAQAKRQFLIALDTQPNENWAREAIEDLHDLAAAPEADKNEIRMLMDLLRI